MQLNKDTEPVLGSTKIDARENEITPQEKHLLDSAGDDAEEQELKSASLDNTDEEGEALNEDSFSDDRTGEDLDVPGTDLDDENEALGEEDEENNAYSLGGDDND